MYKEALKNIRHGLNSTSGDEENYDIITATGTTKPEIGTTNNITISSARILVADPRSNKVVP